MGAEAGPGDAAICVALKGLSHTPPLVSWGPEPGYLPTSKRGSPLSAGFHLYHRLPGLMPESCLLILVGALVGAIIFGTDHKSPPVMDSSIYFLYLLPPIVLEGGYFMPTRPFFENIGSILWWAGLGALINAFGIGLSLYLVCQVQAFGLSDVNLLQNLLFGSLISAVDPVAVLAVFEEARVNQQLYLMIFGEALLNDGISVVRCGPPPSPGRRGAWRVEKARQAWASAGQRWARAAWPQVWPLPLGSAQWPCLLTTLLAIHWLL